MTDTTQKLCNSIGANIKKLRRKKKVGQVKLAEQIYLSRSSLSNIEIGNQQPTLKAIYEIAIALKCEISDILPSTSEYQSLVDNIDSDLIEL
jgi:transcriptional regulator with XRE-family HTH domain